MNQLFEHDREVSQLLPQADNKLSKNLREDLLESLYLVLEFVLLNNITNGRSGSALPPKHLLQERLASLTNAKNAIGQGVSSLRVLDSYLNEKNSSDLIKDALKIAKPFYFSNIVGPRIQEEA